MSYCEFSEAGPKNDKKITKYRFLRKQIKNIKEGVHEKNHEQIFLKILINF